MHRHLRSCISWLLGVAVASGCGGLAPGGAAPEPAVARLPAADTVTIVTLNIWHDREPWPTRLAAIVDELRRLRPDVIALQEVLQHDALPNQAATIAGLLGYDHHFTSVDPPDRPRRYGNAILTPHPVLARGGAPLDPADDYRTVAHLRLEVAGTAVDVYNTHLHHTEEGGAIRRVQLEHLLRFVGETRGDGPVLLAGDFNATAEAPEMQVLATGFLDAYGTRHPDPGDGTHTTLNPSLGHTPRRIDHVFVERGAWTLLEATILLDRPDAGGVWPSDHFAVLARLRPAGARAR